MYKILFDKKALENLNKMEYKIKERILQKIISTAENPFHYFVGLKGRTEYKLRSGDYRILADIDTNSKTIKIFIIDHRKNIYKS